MKMYNQRRSNFKKGFTIIETLVALSIFTFSILGLIVITSQGVSDTNFAKNKLVATYLAQEGIEIVRNMRDTNALGGGTWQTIFQGPLVGCYAAGQITGCDIDPATLTIEPCSLALRSCGPIRYNAANGAYVLGSTNPTLPETPFRRQITLLDMGNAEVEITSVISWTQGTTPRSVTVVEDVFDWISIGQ